MIIRVLVRETLSKEKTTPSAEQQKVGVGKLLAFCREFSVGEKPFQNCILLDVKADLYAFTYVTKPNLG